MAYTPSRSDWRNLPDRSTPIMAENLEHIEQGIVDAHSELDGRLAESSLNSTYVRPDDAVITGKIDASESTAETIPDTVIRRNETGRASVSSPQTASQIANRGYVDTAISEGVAGKLDASTAAETYATPSDVDASVNAGLSGKLDASLIVISATEPASPTVGTIWFDTSAAVAGIDAMDGLLARWDATELAYTDGTVVQSLAPRAGSLAAPLTQGTEANRPIMRISSMISKPVLRFTSASQQWMEAAIGSTLQPTTIVSVFNATVHPTSVFSSGGSTFISLATSATGPSLQASSSGTSAASASTPWSEAAGWWIVVQVADGANSRVYWRARTSVTWRAGDGAGFPANFRVGRNSSANYSTMDLGEFCLFNKALTDAEVQSVLDELEPKYGLTLGA